MQVFRETGKVRVIMDKKFEQMKAKEALLTADYVREVLDYNPETGEFIWKKRAGHIMPGTKAGGIWKNGYCFIKLKGKQYLAQRLAWLYYYGEWPSGILEVDHIDLNKSNNAITNLRLCTRPSNARNHSVYASNSSGVSGVCFNSYYGKWAATIRSDSYRADIKDYKRESLGLYDTFEEAVKARKEAEKKYGYTCK